MLSGRKKKWMNGHPFTDLYKEFGLVECKILLSPKLSHFCLYWYIKALCTYLLLIFFDLNLHYTCLLLSYFPKLAEIMTVPKYVLLFTYQTLLQIIRPCDWHLPKKILGKGLYYFQAWHLKHPEEPNGPFWLPSHPEVGNHWALGQWSNKMKDF